MSAKRNLLIGIGIGAVIGILFAPHKGSKTRKNIAKRGTQLREGWQNLKEKVTDTIAKTNDYLESDLQSVSYINTSIDENWKD